MVPIVRITLALRDLHILVQHRIQRQISFLLRSEGDDCRRAAGYSAAGSGLPAITGGSVLLSEMNMAVDSAGGDVGSLGIDDLGV